MGDINIMFEYWAGRTGMLQGCITHITLGHNVISRNSFISSSQIFFHFWIFGFRRPQLVFVLYLDFNQNAPLENVTQLDHKGKSSGN